jgi:hypothetical protein
MRRLLLLLIATMSAAPAAAETVRCAAVGAAPRVTLDAAISADRQALTVRRLDADMGDFTISTAGDSPNPISDQESADGRLSIGLSDPDDIWIVLRLQLIRDTEFRRLYDDETDENWRSVVAGTLSVMDNGVWPVTCSGW